MNNTDQAKNILMQIIINGRITLNGNPLTMAELAQAQQAVLLLYDQAKDNKEQKQTSRNSEEKPAEVQ